MLSAWVQSLFSKQKHPLRLQGLPGRERSQQSCLIRRRSPSQSRGMRPVYGVIVRMATVLHKTIASASGFWVGLGVCMRGMLQCGIDIRQWLVRLGKAGNSLAGVWMVTQAAAAGFSGLSDGLLRPLRPPRR